MEYCIFCFTQYFASTFEFIDSNMSDNYSYLDQTSDEMTAKGNGGMRQMHNFVKLNQNDKIDTPDEDYEPDKVGQVDLGKIQAQRETDIKLPPQSATASM